MSTIGNYTISTWADGYGTWHARIEFPHGAGNTEAGFRLIDNARAAARRAIRRELEARGNGTPIPALRYRIIGNEEHGTGALRSLTIAEAGTRSTILTEELRKGDRIIVPDHFGEVRIPVTVLRTRFEYGEWTIDYRRDAAEGAHRDYLFAQTGEEWSRA